MATSAPIHQPAVLAPQDGSVAEPTAPPSGLGGWLYERLGLGALTYAVPAHANTLWYTLGGVTFVGLLLLVATGFWLAQYYNPDPLTARESVLFLQAQAPFGDLVRGLHVWTAYLVVVSAVLHLIRVFATAAYKVPREVNWLVGVALLGLLLFGGVFTGTILRWDQEAYEAMAHNVEATAFFGALGGYFSEGFTTSVPMLARLYTAHISIVPLLLGLLLIAHFFLIKHHGISPTPAQADAGRAARGRLPAGLLTARYSTHLRLMGGYGLALLGLAGLLALAWPPPVGPAIDPTLEITKPAFVFYFLYPFENWFGVLGIVYAGVAFFGLLALVPFLDRGPARGWRRRPLPTTLGLLLLGAVLGLSLMTALQPTVAHLGG